MTWARVALGVAFVVSLVRVLGGGIWLAVCIACAVVFVMSFADSGGSRGQEQEHKQAEGTRNGVAGQARRRAPK